MGLKYIWDTNAVIFISKATEKDLILLHNFIADSTNFELEKEVKLKSIEIRKTHKIKLADAIITTTAIVKNLTLITDDKKGLIR